MAIIIVSHAWDKSKDKPVGRQVDENIMAAAFHSRQNNTSWPKAVGGFFPLLMLIMEDHLQLNVDPTSPVVRGYWIFANEFPCSRGKAVPIVS